jgi:cell wall-associated NlpC family hydrolase
MQRMVALRPSEVPKQALPCRKPCFSRTVSARSVRAAPTLALALLLAACASVPRQPASEQTPGQAVAVVAAGLIGSPYRFGGTGVKGFDCSGLAVYAYEKVGIAIPRTAAEQHHSARRVSLHDLAPGDLVFFRIRSFHVNHVGIYVGGGRFIHAPRSDALVSYASLERGFYREHFVSAGRFRP